MNKIDSWLYFGCYRSPGHFIWTVDMYRARYLGLFDRLSHFDGMLAPQENRAPYIATVSRLSGWGLSALSFWDNTVDQRPGSNSTFFAPSLDASPNALIEGAKKFFPQVWERLPEIKFHPSVKGPL